MEVTYVPYNQRQIGASLSKMFKTMATSALQDYKMANNIWRNIFQPKFGDKYPSMARDLKIGNTIMFPLVSPSEENIPYYKLQTVKLSVLITFVYNALFHFIKGSEKI